MIDKTPKFFESVNSYAYELNKVLNNSFKEKYDGLKVTQSDEKPKPDFNVYSLKFGLSNRYGFKSVFDGYNYTPKANFINPYLEENKKRLKSEVETFKALEKRKDEFLKENPNFSIIETENELKQLLNTFIDDNGETTPKELRQKRLELNDEIHALISDLLKVKFSLSVKYLRSFFIKTENSKIKYQQMNRLKKIKAKFSESETELLSTIHEIDAYNHATPKETETIYKEKDGLILSRDIPLFSRVPRIINGKKYGVKKARADKTLNTFNMKGRKRNQIKTLTLLS